MNDKNQYLLTYVLHIVTYTGKTAELIKMQNVWADNPEHAEELLHFQYGVVSNPYSAYYIPEVTDITRTIEYE